MTLEFWVTFAICATFVLISFVPQIIDMVKEPIEDSETITKKVQKALEDGVFLKEYHTSEPVRVVLCADGANNLVLKTTYEFGHGIVLPYRKYGKTWALTREELK